MKFEVSYFLDRDESAEFSIPLVMQVEGESIDAALESFKINHKDKFVWSIDEAQP